MKKPKKMPKFTMSTNLEDIGVKKRKKKVVRKKKKRILHRRPSGFSARETNTLVSSLEA
jgi:hypothetical protein